MRTVENGIVPAFGQVHLIGRGGVGMAAVAEALLERGVPVTPPN
jgi:UDP-N-acetylmuramate-alanine ligase